MYDYDFKLHDLESRIIPAIRKWLCAYNIY